MNREKDVTIFGDEIVLYNILMSHGGIGINYQEEDRVDELLNRGFLKDGMGKKSILLRGEYRDCHQNSAIIWAHNPKKYEWVRGWALTDDDDVWFQHSWIWDNEKRSEICVET